jgi:hypothetical protein
MGALDNGVGFRAGHTRALAMLDAELRAASALSVAMCGRWSTAPKCRCEDHARHRSWQGWLTDDRHGMMVDYPFC